LVIDGFVSLLRLLQFVLAATRATHIAKAAGELRKLSIRQPY
jgi:hypothetical protein